MEKGHMLIVMAVGLVGAFVGGLEAPDGAEPAESSRMRTSSYERSDARAETASSADAGDSLVLERRGDGHFYADVEVNGVPISMLVDTGASAVALSAEDARRAGIATSIGMNEVIEDYIEDDRVNRLAGTANTIFAILVAVVAIGSIAKIVFWG